jgi:alpha-beta hydrolase superfamily lysophospholipase
LATILGALLACAPAAASPRPVSFKTSDGWTLSALYQPPAKSRPVAVLIHGAAAGKGEWGHFASELAGRGFGTLALDLRGHGDSVLGPGGKRTYESFQEADFSAARADVEAALAFLDAKGILRTRVGLIGGSLGANLAARIENTAWTVLLSPGQSYIGVALPQRWTGRRALAAAAPSDGYSFRTCMALAVQPSGPTFLQAKKGHGAQLLDDPDFRKKLLDWLSR